MWKLLEPRSTAASTSGTDFGARRVKDRVSGGEGGTATACGLRVRIANDELRAVQALAVVDLRAGQILDAHRIDEQLHAEILNAGIAVLLLLIEFEPVLHSRATTALHEHAQLEVGIAFTADQVADLACRRICELQGFGVDFSHVVHTTRRILPLQPPARSRLRILQCWPRGSCSTAPAFP